MPGSSLLSPATDLERIAADPAFAILAGRMGGLDLVLAPAGENPDPEHRGRFDTWGEPPRLVLGVPDGASRDEVVAALWQAILLGEGWPEPASSAQGALTADLLAATARSRARSAGADAAELVAGDLRRLCATLDPQAEPDGELARAWCLVVPLGPADRAAAIARIDERDPDLAEALVDLLDFVPGAPRSAAAAADLLDALSRLP